MKPKNSSSIKQVKIEKTRLVEVNDGLTPIIGRDLFGNLGI